MSKKEKITVQGTDITLFEKAKENYISLTDMAKHKNAEATGVVISHWLSTRYTIRFMGIWEQMYNTDFNVTEFGNIKNSFGKHTSRRSDKKRYLCRRKFFITKKDKT